MGQCIYPGCDRESRKRDLCDRDYWRMKRHGGLENLPSHRLEGWVPDRELLIWAAGFYDGEGSFYYVRSASCKSGYLAHASISQSGEIDVLYKFQKAIGFGNIYGPRQVKNYLPAYKWDVSGQYAEETLTLLWPWLGKQKRQDGLNAIAFGRGHTWQPSTDSLFV